MDAVTRTYREVKYKMLDLSALSNSGCDHETFWTAIQEFRQATSDFELAARVKRCERVTA